MKRLHTYSEITSVVRSTPLPLTWAETSLSADRAVYAILESRGLRDSTFEEVFEEEAALKLALARPLR